MKKLLIGCSVVFLIIAVLMFAGGYYGYKKVLEPIYTTSKILVESYERVNEDFPFERPASGLMEEGRYEKFLSVRNALAESGRKMLERLEELDSAEGEVSFIDKLKQAKGLFEAIRDLGMNHVEQLRQEGMSAKEYVWHARVQLATIIHAAEEGRLQEEAPEAASLVEFINSSSKRLENLSQQGQGDLDIKVNGGKQWSQNLRLEEIPLQDENLELIVKYQDEVTRYKNAFIADMFVAGFVN